MISALWYDQQWYSGRFWHLSDAHLLLRSPKCAKKLSPTPLHHHQQPQQPEHHAFMLFRPDSDPAIWMLKQKSRLIGLGNIFSIFCGQVVRIVASFSVLSWALSNSLLHISIVKNGYWSSFSLPVSSRQSGYSPLTCGINNTLLPREKLLNG